MGVFELDEILEELTLQNVSLEGNPDEALRVRPVLASEGDDYENANPNKPLLFVKDWPEYQDVRLSFYHCFKLIQASTLIELRGVGDRINRVKGMTRRRFRELEPESDDSSQYVQSKSSLLLVLAQDKKGNLVGMIGRPEGFKDATTNRISTIVSVDKLAKVRVKLTLLQICHLQTTRTRGASARTKKATALYCNYTNLGRMIDVSGDRVVLYPNFEVVDLNEANDLGVCVKIDVAEAEGLLETIAGVKSNKVLRVQPCDPWVDENAIPYLEVEGQAVVSPALQCCWEGCGKNFSEDKLATFRHHCASHFAAAHPNAYVNYAGSGDENLLDNQPAVCGICYQHPPLESSPGISSSECCLFSLDKKKGMVTCLAAGAVTYKRSNPRKSTASGISCNDIAECPSCGDLVWRDFMRQHWKEKKHQNAALEKIMLEQTELVSGEYANVTRVVKTRQGKGKRKEKEKKTVIK